MAAKDFLHSEITLGEKFVAILILGIFPISVNLHLKSPKSARKLYNLASL